MEYCLGSPIDRFFAILKGYLNHFTMFPTEFSPLVLGRSRSAGFSMRSCCQRVLCLLASLLLTLVRPLRGFCFQTQSKISARLLFWIALVLQRFQCQGRGGSQLLAVPLLTLGSLGLFASLLGAATLRSKFQRESCQLKTGHSAAVRFSPFLCQIVSNPSVLAHSSSAVLWSRFPFPRP